MSFCIIMQHFNHVGSIAPEIWRLIDFQDSNFSSGFELGGSSGQCLSANQISSTYLNSWPRHNASVLEKQTSTILAFYFWFRFRLYHRNRHANLHQATEFYPNWTIYCGNITSFPFFKMADAAAQYYFRFRICWCHCLQKVKVYQQTKSRRHISMHSWDITTSVFEKQMSAILKFYFRFRFWPYWRNLHAILHQDTKFRPNRSTRCGNMTSDKFFKIPVSYLLRSLPWEGQSLLVNQISLTYLNSRLRYNWFRFWKTDVCHIGSLLKHFAVIGVLFCIRLPNFVQIRACTA